MYYRNHACLRQTCLCHSVRTGRVPNRLTRGLRSVQEVMYTV